MTPTVPPKVLYVQYADPRVYPPAERGAALFRERGYDVAFLGVAATGQAAGLSEGQRNDTELVAHRIGGIKAALSYLKFWWRALSRTHKEKIDIVYCSDPMSYPAGLLVSLLTKALTIMHEHDSPVSGKGAIPTFLRWARRAFARRADERVFPQAERAAKLETETGVSIRVVHNCPSLAETQARVQLQDGSSLTFWHHGSLGPTRFPPAIIEAMAHLPANVRLEIAGYETESTIGFMDRLLTRAAELGLGDRVVYHGPMPREALFEKARQADVGIVLLARDFGEPMVGASVKPFDYLACGLPLLVNDTPEWTGFYAERGVALACDPDDPEAIGRAMLRFRDDATLRREMAERGHDLIRNEWNYEAQFGPLIYALEQRLADNGVFPVGAREI